MGAKAKLLQPQGLYKFTLPQAGWPWHLFSADRSVPTNLVLGGTLWRFASGPPGRIVHSAEAVPRKRVGRKGSKRVTVVLHKVSKQGHHELPFGSTCNEGLGRAYQPPSMIEHRIRFDRKVGLKITAHKTQATRGLRFTQGFVRRSAGFGPLRSLSRPADAKPDNQGLPATGGGASRDSGLGTCVGSLQDDCLALLRKPRRGPDQTQRDSLRGQLQDSQAGHWLKSHPALPVRPATGSAGAQVVAWRRGQGRLLRESPESNDKAP